MVDQIVCNKTFLKQLSGGKQPADFYLTTANPKEILLLVEICFNILNSRVTLNKQEVKRLTPFAHFVRRLAKTTSQTAARRILCEVPAAFYSALIKPLLKKI